MAGDPPLEDDTQIERSATDATVPLPSDASHEPASLARVAAARMATPVPPLLTPSLSLTSAADALRNEEIERTRLSIVMGWVSGVIAIGTVPFVAAPQVTATLFVA